MNNYSRAVFNDARANLRVKENAEVSWNIKDSDTKGKGTIRNISASGMLMETNSSFQPKEDCVIAFDTVVGMNNFIPQLGRLVWHKSGGIFNKKMLCGVEFIKSSEEIVAKLRERVQEGIARLSRLRKVEAILNIFILPAIILVIMYLMNLSAAVYKNITLSNQKLLSSSSDQALLTSKFSQLYRETEIKLESTLTELQTTKQLYDEVSKELDSTKTLLSQTETLLSQAQASNAGLTRDLESVKTAKAELENSIAPLREKNAQLSQEIQQIQGQLDYLNGNVKSQEEAKGLLTLYRSKIKLVRSKITNFKREAETVRIAALKERDRVRSILGNNGYLVRNGQVVKVDMQKYSSGILDTTTQPTNINIDVKFVK